MVVLTIIKIILGVMIIGEILFWMNADFDSEDYIFAILFLIMGIGFVIGVFKGWKSLLDGKKIYNIL
jgi:hypothetical protein